MRQCFYSPEVSTACECIIGMTDLIIGFTFPAIVVQTVTDSSTLNHIYNRKWHQLRSFRVKSCQMGGLCCYGRFWGGVGGLGRALDVKKLGNPCAATAWYFNFYFKRVVVTLACSGPTLICTPSLQKMNSFQRNQALGKVGMSPLWQPPPSNTHTHNTHSLSFSTPPADHCQITICIIICSAQKRKLTPKFYGSTNCNNQCFIGYTKGEISLTIMVEELSFSPSRPFSINSIQLLYWHDCLSETIFPKQFKKCKFTPHPCFKKDSPLSHPLPLSLSTWANTFSSIDWGRMSGLSSEVHSRLYPFFPFPYSAPLFSAPALYCVFPQEKRSLI